MKQDMIVILDLGSHENTVLARAIRALGVYSDGSPIFIQNYSPTFIIRYLF